VDGEKSVLERMGLSTEPLSGGCCGLAGSWGFERGKYGISMECGEQALLPAVRDAAEDAVVVANGFSCKTQIAEAGTGRKALHLAQVMQLARAGGTKRGGSLLGDLPEKAAPGTPKPSLRRRARRLGTAGLLAATAAGGAVAVARRTAR
jgi:hypothetical protein